MIDQERTRCPTCNAEVVIARRADGSADHYEPPLPIDKVLTPQDEDTASYLREQRKGKKTVALVGMGEMSAGLAPYKENVELWSLNETHLYSWMKRATRWFQIHPREIWTREFSGRGERGHAEWIKENPWNIPVYTRFHNDEIPNSIEYPLQKMVDMFFFNFHRGMDEIREKYFTSTFCYMVALALSEKFKRLELYGFDFLSGTKFADQRAGAEFWVGQALGRGTEVYVSDNSELLTGELYGFSKE